MHTGNFWLHPLPQVTKMPLLAWQQRLLTTCSRSCQYVESVWIKQPISDEALGEAKGLNICLLSWTRIHFYFPCVVCFQPKLRCSAVFLFRHSQFCHQVVPELYSMWHFLWLLFKIRVVVFKTASRNMETEDLLSSADLALVLDQILDVSSAGISTWFGRAAELWRKRGGRFRPHLPGEETFHHTESGQKQKKNVGNVLQ